jgi:hypothetical protein
VGGYVLNIRVAPYLSHSARGKRLRVGFRRNETIIISFVLVFFSVFSVVDFNVTRDRTGRDRMFFSITPILILLFIAIVGIIWSITVLIPPRGNVVAERLEQMKGTKDRRIKKEVLPTFQKMLKYVTDLLPAPQEKKVSRYRSLLVLAGFRNRESARIFYG